MGVLGVLWHLVILDPFYAGEFPFIQDVVRYDVIALAYLALGFLMAIVYPKGYTGGPPTAEGFRFGIIVGLMCALPAGMVMYAVTGAVSGALVLAEAAWHMVEQGAGGMVIAMLSGIAGEPGEERPDLGDDSLR